VEALREEGQTKAPRPSDSRIKRLLGLSRQCSDMEGVPDQYVGLTFGHIKGMLASDVEQGITTLVPFVRQKEGASQSATRAQPQKGNGIAANQGGGQAGNTADRPRKIATAGQSGGDKNLPPLTPGARGAPEQRTREDLAQTKAELGKSETAEKEVAKRLKALEGKCKKSRKLNWLLGGVLIAAVVAWVVLYIMADNAIDRAKAKQKASTLAPTAAPTKTESGTSTSKFRVVPRLPQK
jgi:hypothetical protein